MGKILSPSYHLFASRKEKIYRALLEHLHLNHTRAVCLFFLDCTVYIVFIMYYIDGDAISSSSLVIRSEIWYNSLYLVLKWSRSPNTNQRGPNNIHAHLLRSTNPPTYTHMYSSDKLSVLITYTHLRGFTRKIHYEKVNACFKDFVFCKRNKNLI